MATKSQNPKDLSKIADQLLDQNGYDQTGQKKRRGSKCQRFFERRIIMTPMGNQSR